MHLTQCLLFRACSSGKRQAAGNGINSQDQLLSPSTDDQEEYSMVDLQVNCLEILPSASLL